MIKMEGNNYNQRLIVQLPNEICRTLIGQGHSGMEPKVIVCISKKNDNICREYRRKTN